MICEKCGYSVNPGDQVCINCGAKLSSDNAFILGVDKIIEAKKKNNKPLIFLGMLLGVLVIVFIIMMVIMKG